ncbi:uncharacterized protein VSU04_001053 isoform 1-T1 [Chlamydotis macqueenii]
MVAAPSGPWRPRGAAQSRAGGKRSRGGRAGSAAPSRPPARGGRGVARRCCGAARLRFSHGASAGDSHGGEIQHFAILEPFYCFSGAWEKCKKERTSDQEGPSNKHEHLVK